MTIAKKPDRTSAMQFIGQGGTVPKAATQVNAPKPVLLRFPDDQLLSGIEQQRKAGGIKISRTAWILMAIAEKFERDAPS